VLVGIPKEVKNNEFRVSTTPAGVHSLVIAGHTVFVEKSAGVGSAITDAEYVKAGATILDTADDVWAKSEMIIKVKEPIAEEYHRMRKGQILFTYLHLAASRECTDAIVKSGITAIAYETVEVNGQLPLLAPMSEVAGRMSIQEGAKYLEKPMGGRGVLLGGVPGVKPAEVLVLGGGIVGTQAAKMAAGLGARVTMMDISLPRLRQLDDIMPANVETMISNEYNVRNAIKTADLVIGGVLIPGAKAPKLITRDMLPSMKKGAVIVDVAIDQGGCFETSKPTTHAEPCYEVDGVVHYCVANMPGAVPYTSTLALTNATLPYAVQLANKGWKKACADSNELKLGLNVINGKVVYKGVAEAFNLEYTEVDSFLN
jgi:alanine dehydrogenase